MSSTVLLRRAFPDVAFEDDSISSLPFIQRLRAIGELLASAYGVELQRGDSCWVSDTVRGWLAMAAAADSSQPLEEVLTRLRPYARDHHFAVREWAWLAARPFLVADPGGGLSALRSFFTSDVPFDRRFAAEVTRPRSVWGQHIRAFVRQPELAEETLTLLKCDPDRYVRTAVANWLNDASRSRPDWTLALTARWTRHCACPFTIAIAARGLRRLRHRS
jgi:3-methyladenine DNA glycosylase AlkC